MKVSVQREDFDLGAEIAALRRAIRRSARSRASSAWCATCAMTLEHYPGMTEKAIERSSTRRAGAGT